MGIFARWVWSHFGHSWNDLGSAQPFFQALVSLNKTYLKHINQSGQCIRSWQIKLIKKCVQEALTDLAEGRKPLRVDTCCSLVHVYVWSAGEQRDQEELGQQLAKMNSTEDWSLGLASQL